MINLLDFDRTALNAFFAERGEKPFRARQTLRWIHHRLADRIEAMSDLARASREALMRDAEIRAPSVVRDASASDGTRKWLLDVGGANAIETVYIPEGARDDWRSDSDIDPTPKGAANVPNAVASIPSAGRSRSAGPSAHAPGRYRGTLCISSQAGCALDCAFCSTGKQGFNRNLSVAEIIGQLWLANRTLLADGVSAKGRPERELRPLGGAGGRVTAPWVEHGRHPITNVVMMGMGEPLANFDNVVAAMRLMLDDDAYGLSRRRVTLSTSGLVPAIDRLREQCPVALAVSLHAPDDALRDTLVPINRKYPLADLLAACRRYIERAPRDFVTFEYVMLDGVNDAPAQARALVARVRDVPCKFNLIPFNPFPNSGFRTSSRSRILGFQNVLQGAGLVATIRKTRGEDIDAACGQLAGRVQDKTRRRAHRIAVAAP